MNIVYIATEPTIAGLFLPIAEAFRKLRPEARNILVDPSEIFDFERSEGSPAVRFKAHGFDGEIVDSGTYPDLAGLDHNQKGYLFFLRLYKRLSPSVVMVPHEFSYAFYAVQAARLLGIPSIHIQHALWGPYRFDSALYSDAEKTKTPAYAKGLGLIRKALQGTKNLHPDLIPFKEKLVSPPDEPFPIYADRVAIFGEYYREMLERTKPYLKGKLDLVGYIRGDFFYNRPVEPKQAICRRYSLEDGNRLAVYFYAPFHDVIRPSELNCDPNGALIDALKALRTVDKDINILILAHPNYRFEHYKNELQRLAKDAGLDRVRVDQAHDDHFSIYKAASVVAGVKSTMFYEVMLAGRPAVLQSYVLKTVDDPQHIEGGALAPVLARPHLLAQVRRALEDRAYVERMLENQKMVTAELLGRFDGKCGERVAEAVIKHTRVHI